MNAEETRATLLQLTHSWSIRQSVPEHLAEARRMIALALLSGQSELLISDQRLPVPNEIDQTVLNQMDVAVSEALIELDRITPPLVFIRSLPLLTHHDPASIPAWAAGRAQLKSIGPFIDDRGFRFWVDSYEASLPDAFIIDIAFARPDSNVPFLRVSLVDSTIQDEETELDSGTVWIHAREFAPTAPDGYVGLRIKGGLLRINGPFEGLGTIIIDPQGSIDLALDLDPSTQTGPGATRIELPQKVSICFAPAVAANTITTADLSLDLDADTFTLHRTSEPASYARALNSIAIPFDLQPRRLKIENQISTLYGLDGSADIEAAAWTLPITEARSDLLREAAGVGGLALILASGLTAMWSGLTGGPVRLNRTIIEASPGLLVVVAPAAENHLNRHHILLWPEAGGERRSSIDVAFDKQHKLTFLSSDEGIDAILASATVAANLDRPLHADGTRSAFHCQDSVFRIIEDSSGHNVQISAVIPRPILIFSPPVKLLPLALSNALLLTEPAEVLTLAGRDLVDGSFVVGGNLTSLFGLHGILPILPDPYTANYDLPREIFRSPSAWLVSRASWEDPDSVIDHSLHIADIEDNDIPIANLFSPHLAGSPTPDSEDHIRLRNIFNRELDVERESLLLLDVSSRADLFGVGLGFRPPEDTRPQTSIRNLSLVMPACNVRVFTVPQIQWEPVWTVQNPDLPTFPSPLTSEDDGGATFIGIDTVNLVPIEPEQVLRSLVAEFQRPEVTAAALFTLPFGMKAVAAPLRIHNPNEPTVSSAALDLIQPKTQERGLQGGLQISLTAIDPLSTPERESPRFPGSTIQLLNGIDPGSGVHLGLSVLADKVQNAVQDTFNAEFGPGSVRARVPVTRVDFSGYGASLFSHWQNPKAITAETSQVYFDVMVGRTAHEVVQIKSVLYPWGVRVVRTITIERTSGGGVFRRDSGWVAVSDGIFEFPQGSTIETHPGVIKGVFNVRRIRDTEHAFERTIAGVKMRMVAVRFDADIRISDVIVGESNGFVPGVDQVGFIQISPTKDPLTPKQYAALLEAEGPIGGPVDCIIDIGSSGQKMRVTRIDVDVAPRQGGESHFAAAARGSLLLPKDGQWSFVRKPVDFNDDCIPADPHTGVPLVRQGIRTLSDIQNTAPYLFAEPADLFVPGTSGYDVALLWSMGMQRILFPRPLIPKDIRAVRGAVAPLLADFFATAATSAVFPSTGSCLEVPFPNYSLNITGDSQLRLEPPSLSFAAKRVSGGPRREISQSASIRTFSDYTNTRFTIALDSSAPKSWSYEQTGVAMVQELDGVHAKTSHGIFHASSNEAIRWTLVHEEFGDLFAEPKTLFPLFNSGVAPGPGLPSGVATVPLETSKESEGPNPKIGLRLELDIKKGLPTFIGHTTGGHLEIITDFQRFFSMEVVIGIAIAEIFPGGGLFKMEFEALRRKVLPNSDTTVRAGSKAELVLAIGVYISNEHPVPFPFPHQFNWDIFIGIGFALERSPGEKSVGLGIIFQASGSVQYPLGFALAEVGVNVEGQGLISFQDGDTFIVCKGSLSIEITVAFLLDIEWEIVEGEIYKQKI